MTISKDYSINMSDIKAVRLLCHKCKTSLSLPATDIRKDPPEHCANCGEDWFGYNTTETKQLKLFLAALRVFTERTGTPVCQVQLEVSQPD